MSHEKNCGLEVHKDSVFVCILGENGDKIQEKFGILTSKLDKFRNLLIENAIGEVAIKSTRVYRMPIWRVLENYFSLKLENSYYLNNSLAGRVTGIQHLCQYDRRIFDLNKKFVYKFTKLNVCLQWCNNRFKKL